MAVHRWRCVIDFYALPMDEPMRERVDTLLRTFFAAIFPLGVVEGYPDTYPDPKPLRRLPRAKAWAQGLPPAWRTAVLARDQGCLVHTNPADCSDGWQAHHVVPQQVLRRLCPDALWNENSGMGVCGLAHRQHHSRVRPILLDQIPEPVFDYLRGLGFAPYLERHYPASGAPQRGRQA